MPLSAFRTVAPNWKITRDLTCACGCTITIEYSAWLDIYEERLLIEKTKNNICPKCNEGLEERKKPPFCT